MDVEVRARTMLEVEGRALDIKGIHNKKGWIEESEETVEVLSLLMLLRRSKRETLFCGKCFLLSLCVV